jgi:NAD(P)H dehydrogenase (quinone)
MTVAVTGATGQLGRLVVSDLLEKQTPESIIAVVRDAGKAADMAARGVQVRVAPYQDTAALRAALAGVDKLLLISSSEVGQRSLQHRNVIDAAKSAGVRHVVYTSAPQATTSTLMLAPEHKATEEYLAASGIPFTIVRNNWYTENYAAALEMAEKTGVIVAAAGRGRVASASRADYAAGAVAVLLGEGHNGKTYEFAGAYAWNFDELAEAIGAVLGKQVTYKAVDAPTLAEMLKGNGVGEWLADFLAALDNDTAQNLLAQTSPDLSRLIGRPTTPLKDGLAAMRR